MKRSPTQVLLKFLPDAVFDHEEGFIAKVDYIVGQHVGDVNVPVLLEELGDELERWSPEQRGLPNPRTNPGEFVVSRPIGVSWDVYPLTFECLGSGCGRIVRFFNRRDLVRDTNSQGRLRCTYCGSRVRQLRYLTAHNCGSLEPMQTIKCGVCNDYSNMYLEDYGSFLTSSWRCRQCGWSQGTRLTPCTCHRYAPMGSTSYRRGFTERDQRLWFPQTLTLINISNATYNDLLQNPQRGVAALASWIGDETDVAASIRELGHTGGTSRQTSEEWAATAATLRASGIDETTIANLKVLQGPVEAGVASVVVDVPAAVLEAANKRQMVERAGLFDRRIVEDRRSFHDLLESTSGPERTAADYTEATLASFGINDVSVTLQFPILLASYGYSRCQREPGTSDLRSYASPNQYGGRTPIFTVPAHTEALLVTLDARFVLGFLEHEGLVSGPVPDDERSARLSLAELLAAEPEPGSLGAAGCARRLVHSASHALLRALDDGRSGFGESSLAEWVVPDALTTAIYVVSYNDFTLGALDTVLRRRVAQWVVAASEAVWSCDNDPLCSHTSHHRPFAACDRCLHLSFGCRTWNADLDRLLLRRFWSWTQQRVGGV